MNAIQSVPALPNFLPGTLTLRQGSSTDYPHLEPFHYRAGPPATWAAVWCVRYRPRDHSPERLAAIGVLSFPMAMSRGRAAYFNLAPRRYGQMLRFANANIRTISRVIVHPQFRGLGLASTLIHCLCAQCPTRYVEAIAVMGRAHPMFEKAGMTRVIPPAEPQGSPAYFIFDRQPQSPSPLQEESL